MVSGMLTLKVHTEAPNEESVQLRVRIGKEDKQTRRKSVGEQELKFNLVNELAENATFEIIGGDSKAITSTQVALASLLNESKGQLEIDGYKVMYVSSWSGAAEEMQTEKKEAAQTNSTSAPDPQNALLAHPTHRPDFMRVSYYYDLTKNVYTYATGFRLVSRVARFGENSVNTVLQKVSGRDLATVDNAVVPLLEHLDNNVDEAINAVLARLVSGQQYVLLKKDQLVDKVSQVSNDTSDSVSKAYQTTRSSVVQYSGKAYETVRGSAVLLVSYVPWVGAKLS